MCRAAQRPILHVGPDEEQTGQSGLSDEDHGVSRGRGTLRASLVRGRGVEGEVDGMGRPGMLMIAALCLATGLVLAGIGTAVIDRPRPVVADQDSGVDATNLVLARRFYAAVNTALGSGETAWLDELVAAELVEHPARVAADGAAGLRRNLLADRTIWPGMRLVVDELLVTEQDIVIAWVHPEAPGNGSFPSVVVPAIPADWGPIDVLRIVEGRIVEHWGGSGAAQMLELLWQSSPVRDDAGAVLRMERQTYRADAVAHLSSARWPRLLYVEAGTVHVGLDRTGDGSATPEASASASVLGIDDFIEVPADTPATVRNPGQGVAMLMVVTMAAQLAGATSVSPADEPPVDGIEVRSLYTFPLAGGTGTSTLGRVTIGAGATLTMQTESEATQVLVERGTVVMASSSQGLVAWNRDGESRVIGGDETLVAGETLHFREATTGLWQAGPDGPVVLLLLTEGARN